MQEQQKVPTNHKTITGINGLPGQVYLDQDLLPQQDLFYSIGTSLLRWLKLHAGQVFVQDSLVVGNLAQIGQLTVVELTNTGSLVSNSTIQASGNITTAANYFGSSIGFNIYVSGANAGIQLDAQGNITLNSTADSNINGQGSLITMGGIFCNKRILCTGDIVGASNIYGNANGFQLYINGANKGLQFNSVGDVLINSTTNSTSTTTGAIKCQGGASFMKDMFIGGTLTVPIISIQQALSVPSLELPGYLLVNDWTALNSLIINGAANLPPTTNAGLFIAGNQPNFTQGRMYIGDGSGRRFHFSKRSASTTTDVITIDDNGGMAILGPVNINTRIICGSLALNGTTSFYNDPGTLNMLINTGTSITGANNASNNQQATLSIVSNSTYSTNVGASLGFYARALDFGGGNLHQMKARITGVDSPVGSYSGDLTFEVLNNGSLVERMRLTRDGRLGIGLSNPSSTLHVNGSLLVNDWTALNSLIINGVANLPPTTNAGLFIAGNQPNFTQGRMYIGDGSGRRFHFSKRSASTTTDVITIDDNGGMAILGPVTMLNNLRMDGSELQMGYGNSSKIIWKGALPNAFGDPQIAVTMSGGLSTMKIYASEGGTIETISQTNTVKSFEWTVGGGSLSSISYVTAPNFITYTYTQKCSWDQNGLNVQPRINSAGQADINTRIRCGSLALNGTTSFYNDPGTLNMLINTGTSITGANNASNNQQATLSIVSNSTHSTNVGASLGFYARALDFGGGNLHQMKARITGVDSPVGSYSGDLTFEVLNNGSLVERMRLTRDGRLGIGLSNPSSTLHVNGSLAKSSGTFLIKHPLEKLASTTNLIHSFIEGPRCDLIYRGTIALVGGKAIVDIDRMCTSDESCAMTAGTFVALCENSQYFLQNQTNFDRVIGKLVGSKLEIISENNASTATISWMVIAERNDEHIRNTEITNKSGKLMTEMPQIEYDKPGKNPTLIGKHPPPFKHK